MTPVAQTIFGTVDPDEMPGNCVQAAVASLLDLPLDDVPHFVGDDWGTKGEKNWWTALWQWLAGRGFQIRHGEPHLGEIYIAQGPSPRDPERVSHVALYRDGELVHDPHPDGTGVVEVRTRFIVRPIQEENQNAPQAE